jgi:putative transposase
MWRTLKYECIYLHDYATVRALEAGLATFFAFYNEERLHAALDYLTPAAMYAAA